VSNIGRFCSAFCGRCASLADTSFFFGALLDSFPDGFPGARQTARRSPSDLAASLTRQDAQDASAASSSRWSVARGLRGRSRPRGADTAGGTAHIPGRDDAFEACRLSALSTADRSPILARKSPTKITIWWCRHPRRTSKARPVGGDATIEVRRRWTALAKSG
jgi:hypothetical protein